MQRNEKRPPSLYPSNHNHHQEAESASSSCSCSDSSDEDDIKDGVKSQLSSTSSTSSESYSESYSSSTDDEADAFSRTSFVSEGVASIESDLSTDWISESTNRSNGSLFYTQILPRDEEEGASRASWRQYPGRSSVNSSLNQSLRLEAKSPSQRIKERRSGKDKNRRSSFDKIEGLRSSYSRLASWVHKKNKKAKGLDKNADHSNSTAFEQQSSQQTTKGMEGKSVTPSTLSSNNVSSGCCTRNDEACRYLVRLLMNEDETDPQPDHKLNDQFVLMYLTTSSPSLPVASQSSEENEKEKTSDQTSFFYPSVSESHGSGSSVEVIKKLKGMFLTLSGVVHDITNQRPVTSRITVSNKQQERSSSRQSHQRQSIEECKADKVQPQSAEDEEYSVGHVHHQNSILIVAVSDVFDSSVMSVQDLVESLDQSLRFMFGSLEKAFGCESRKLVTSFFNIFTSQVCFPNYNSIMIHPLAVQRMILEDEELQLNISDTLTEYEARNWLRIESQSVNGVKTVGGNKMPFIGGCAEDFIVVGTALFSKGMLISSHLPSNFLSMIVKFMQLRGLIRLSQVCNSKTVSWMEVFPSEAASENQASSRFFLLIVIVKQSILSVLLEVPFISVTSKIMANEEIIVQTLRFLISNFHRTGIISDIDELIALEEKYDEITAFSVLETDVGQRTKLRSSFKSVSLRDMFKLNDDVNTSNMNLRSRSPRSSLLASESNSSKSCSTPSLLQSASPFSAPVLVTGVKDYHASGNPLIAVNHKESESHEVLLRHPHPLNTKESASGSLHPHSETHSSCSDRTQIMSLDDYATKWRSRFPDNMILFLDFDATTNSVLCPVLNHHSLKYLHSQTCSQQTNLFNHQLLGDILVSFRKGCLLLQKRLSLQNNLVTEHGILIMVEESKRESGLNPENASSSETPRNIIRTKKSQIDQQHALWITCLVLSAKRQVYCCFIVNPVIKGKGIMNIDLESIAYAFSLLDQK